MNSFRKNIYKTQTEQVTLLPVMSYWYKGQWEKADTVHVPPGGNVVYKDEYGNTITQSGFVSEYCEEIIASSIISTFGVNTCIN